MKNFKIFVSNLPFTVGRHQLRNFFASFGPVKKAEVAYDWKTGFSKGFGFVIFKEEEGFERALEIGSTELEGNKIFIRKDFTENVILNMAEFHCENSENLQIIFNSASTYVRSIVSKLSNEKLLEFYALYKQATEGPCKKPKPSWLQFSEKQKWEAWSSLKNLDSLKAMEQYVALLNSVEPQWREKPVENINSWIHHSCMKNNEEVIKDSNKTIFDWVKEKNLMQVKACSSGFASEINKLDDSGLSLLHWASDRGSLEIVKFLVEQLKADVNLKDSNGQTALHYAVSCEYDDVVKYLIDVGANVNLTDNEGQTPFDVK